MDAPQIRPVTAFDLTLLAELHRASFTSPWDQAWSAASFAEVLAMPGAAGWLLEAGGEPWGFVLVRFTIDEGEILLTGVLPARRRRGAGRHLMEAAIGAARAAGLRKLFLEHAAPNDAAALLYRGLGFAEVGRRKQYYRGAGGAAVDAIVLALEPTGRGPVFPTRRAEQQ